MSLLLGYIKGMAFKIIRNDITKVKADVLVNSANTEPICAGYRTDAAIYEAAGFDDMLAARQKIGKIEVGHAEVTPAFKLPAKYVIHTVGPMWVDGKSGEPEALRSCYRECLSKAVSLRAKSIAFPLISTGAFKFPKDQALDIVTEIAKEFTSEHKLDVILVVYDEESFGLTSDLTDFVQAYIDEHYVGKVTEERLEMYSEMNSSEEERWQWRGESSLPRRGKFNGKIRDEDPLCEQAAIDKISVCMSPRGVVPLEKSKKKETPKPVFASFKGKLEEDLQKKIGGLKLEPFGKCLARYLYEKKLESSTVYNAVFMDRKHFSKILSDKIKTPKRETILALAVGMKLNVVETKDLLSHAGYLFDPNNCLMDVIVAAFIEQKVYNVFRINSALFENNQPQLG